MNGRLTQKQIKQGRNKAKQMYLQELKATERELQNVYE